ncbi:MAG: flagellar basal body-associated FliL family protein [Treponema sp.]|nr:flagellar basal body-associated FliL family protein [Treponema sp.]
MADDAAADLGDDLGGAGDAPAKKGGLKGAFPALLKWILIALAAVIFIVTVVFIAVKLMTKGGSSNTAIPISEEYTTQHEELEWYTSLEDIRTQTADKIAASVSVKIALGYKKDDKQASSEITARRIEIIDYLRRYFSGKTAEELGPTHENEIKIEIRDGINDNILSNSKIRSVMFTAKDVVSQ